MIWNLRNEVTMIVILSFPSFSSRPNNPKTVYVNIYGFPIILIKLISQTLRLTSRISSVKPANLIAHDSRFSFKDKDNS